MNDRIARLVQKTQGRPVRFGIVSMYDVENNAVRILAAALRQAGHHVAEIYFKDWISNHLDPATDEELQSLIKVIADEHPDPEKGSGAGDTQGMIMTVMWW